MREVLGAIRGLAASSTVRRVASALVLSAAGVTAIVTHEGSVNKVYLDPVGIPTACVGHTATVTRADVGKNLSDEVCRQLLVSDTRAATAAVQRAVKVPITQEQFDALVSLTFNVGGGNLVKSTLLRKLNAGDCWGAGKEFPKWVYARGVKLRGLVIRRDVERAMFETGCRNEEDSDTTRDTGRRGHAAGATHANAAV